MKNTVNNFLLNNRFVFQETPTEKPTAQQTMGEFMPTVERVDQPIESDLLEEMTKGYPEVKINKYKNLVGIAQAEVKKAARGALPHQASIPLTGEDGHEYVYVRDNTKNPPDRLFRSPEEKISVVDNVLEVGYIEAPKKMADRIAKAAKSLFRPEDKYVVVEFEGAQGLVANRIIKQEEADEIEGNVAVVVKAKGKYRVYLGWEAGA